MASASRKVTIHGLFNVKLFIYNVLGAAAGGGHGNSLQYSCIENPLDRRAWWATVHGTAKSWTCLKQLSNLAKNPAKTNQDNIQNFPFTTQFQLSNLEETTVKVCCIQIFKKWK